MCKQILSEKIKSVVPIAESFEYSVSSNIPSSHLFQSELSFHNNMLSSQSEIDTYDCLVFRESGNSFWSQKSNRLMFPRLFQLYRYYSSTPASSIGVERIFSAASYLVTDKNKK